MSKERVLSGSKWRATHQATVDAILAPLGDKVPVKSRGNMFTNQDSWTARKFGAVLCEWARLNPGKTPDRWTIEGWIDLANQPNTDQYGRPLAREITIANTPDDLPQFLAMALVGGGYHEAWHTEFSRRSKLKSAEIVPELTRLWALIPWEPENGKNGWAGLVRPLLDWANLIEDIRIERLGNEKYAGAKEKLEALQDLILKMEQEDAEQKVSDRAAPTNPELKVVTCAFRDLGLGYQTPRQLGALETYKKEAAAAYAFVESGPLASFLERAKNLGKEDDLACLWLAMEIIAKIVESSAKPPPPPPPKEKPQKTPPQKTPPPPPQDAKPQEVPDEDEEQEGGEGPPPAPQNPVRIWKAGQRAMVDQGPLKGQTVEITWAGIPDKTGHQELKYAVVEPD